MTSACGECGRCRAGRSAKCRSLRKAGHEALASAWPLSGAYATHVLLPAGHATVRVPDGLSDPLAAVSSCAGATVMAAIAAAPGLHGARVLISGAGMLGLLAVIAARIAGAAHVTVVDPSPERRLLAERAGADAVLAPGSLAHETVDVALELSGAAPAVAVAIDALDVGGCAVLVGSVLPGPSVPVDPERIVRSHLRIVGVHNYEPEHLVAAVALLAEADSPVLVDPAVLSAPIGLEEIPRSVMGAPTHLRTIVVP